MINTGGYNNIVYWLFFDKKLNPKIVAMEPKIKKKGF